MMGNINIEKGGGRRQINSARRKKEEGCMTFGGTKMLRECVSTYYEEPTFENCVYFKGSDISEERYQEYLDFCGSSDTI